MLKCSVGHFANIMFLLGNSAKDVVTRYSEINTLLNVNSRDTSVLGGSS
uniref:Uncharacterized protein n=1 Tax=Anguilla anguilla TaxID=7936 RepID=A0A0E9RYZ0_ANGAN